MLQLLVGGKSETREETVLIVFSVLLFEKWVDGWRKFQKQKEKKN